MAAELQDKTLICKECGAEFPFTVRDQEFYKQNDFVEPKRCKPCRQRNKRRRNERQERGD